MRRTLLPIVAAGLVLAGCSGPDAEPEAGPTTAVTTAAVGSSTTDAGPTATATPADPFAIPDVIDAAYVNRVLAELYRIDGDVLRRVLTSESLSMDDLAPLRAIYNDPQYETQASNILEVTRTRDIFRVPPGDRRVTVKRIHDDDLQCMILEVAMDFSAVVLEPRPPPPGETEFVALAPTQQDADSSNLNRTPWSISDAEVLPIGQLPDRPCE